MYMLSIYAFRDKKSGVLLNFFFSSEPFEKVKQNVSVSLLQLSMKENSNPFVLFSDDYQLVRLGSVLYEEIEDDLISKFESVDLSVLLAASRKAFDKSSIQTSPTEVSEDSLE